MIHLTFLGTSAGIPTQKRNVTSLVIRRENEKKIALVDCGEGTQRQILWTPHSLARIESIFITHLHGDHVYGLPGLINTRSMLGSLDPLTIIGPKGIKNYVEAVLRATFSYPKYALNVIEVTDSSEFDLWDFAVKPVLMNHNALTYSYVFSEKKPRQTFLIEKARECGIPPGPVYKNLKNGETISLEDGRVFSGRDFLGPQTPPIKFIVGGDNKDPEKLKDYVDGLRLLVHEATFLQEDLGDQWHTTVEGLARFAAQYSIPCVAFTHLSPRYDDYESIRRYRQAVEANYQGRYCIAEDFLTVNLDDEKVTFIKN